MLALLILNAVLTGTKRPPQGSRNLGLGLAKSRVRYSWSHQYLSCRLASLSRDASDGVDINGRGYARTFDSVGDWTVAVNVWYNVRRKEGVAGSAL